MPTIYACVNRLVAVKKLLEQRGSLTAEETVEALPDLYSDRDQARANAMRTARRDFENLIALGFPVFPVAPKRKRGQPPRLIVFYWGAVPPAEEFRARRFPHTCDRCGKEFWNDSPDYAKYCPACKKERQEELKATRRAYSRARYQAKRP